MKLNVWKATTLVLAGALALVVGRGATVSDADAERQPHMVAALEHLEIAKKQLATAANDKAGHRVKAVALVDQAIAEVRKGVEAANADARVKVAPPPAKPGGGDQGGAPSKPTTHRVENPK